VTAGEKPRSAGVEERLDVVIRLLAAQLTKGMSRKEQILTLSAAGLAPKEVGAILGITGNQVSVALYDAKRAPAKHGKAPTAKV
jgi:hypothetical protein